ncbi:hypothetical protein [Robertkochia sediminum]|uniref:hypothetical protein n=1 Tax=Robertkochia sediminum TaxID=2785326 RepID=UPI001931AE57|nr:hypothetical protein [Robertkochia sediminum]MBL7472817.1 hypothetical protein [Robertkochia sediminum]
MLLFRGNIVLSVDAGGFRPDLKIGEAGGLYFSARGIDWCGWVAKSFAGLLPFFGLCSSCFSKNVRLLKINQLRFDLLGNISTFATLKSACTSVSGGSMPLQDVRFEILK